MFWAGNIADMVAKQYRRFKRKYGLNHERLGVDITQFRRPGEQMKLFWRSQKLQTGRKATCRELQVVRRENLQAVEKDLAAKEYLLCFRQRPRRWVDGTLAFFRRGSPQLPRGAMKRSAGTPPRHRHNNSAPQLFLNSFFKIQVSCSAPQSWTLPSLNFRTFQFPETKDRIKPSGWKALNIR